MSDGLKAKFKIIDLNLRFRLVEAAKRYTDEITKINLGNATAFFPYYMSKIRTNLITQGIKSYIWPNAIRGKLPKQVGKKIKQKIMLLLFLQNMCNLIIQPLYYE